MNDRRRVDRLLRQVIADQALDLAGLTVYTEAASGPYLYTPILAALAGAERVFALAADSRFGRRDTVRAHTNDAAAHWQVADTVSVVFAKERADVAQSDIITNSGFVRPIDRTMIEWMKPTAVVPLMWEPWEFREGDLDLAACVERDVVVMGTDEGRPPHDLYPYAGFLGIKLLFELGLEAFRCRTILLGGGDGLGRSIATHFARLRLDVAWFSETEPDTRHYSELPQFVASEGADYDAIILAEHKSDRLLLGDAGLIPCAAVRAANPAMAIGVISGKVDSEALRTSGLRVFPEVIQPFGTMTYQPYALGPRPVLELYAAGLKVGEVVARARLQGLSSAEARLYAAAHSPALDVSPRHLHEARQR
jgi:hypothetical protein